jgi:hypothetical protein
MFIGESSVALRRLSTPIFERPYASRTRDRAEIHVFRDEALRRSPQLRRGPLDRCVPRAGDAQPPLTAKAVKPKSFVERRRIVLRDGRALSPVV